MFAVVNLDFEPTISPFGLAVRLETLALAAVILFVLLAAAWSAGRMRRVMEREAAEGASPGRMRRDDLLLIAFGAIPGAVVGARIDYGLIHYDYFSIDAGRLLDPAQGGLALTLAVGLGTLTAIAVGLLLAAPISRWLHVAAVPLLLGLGLGKLVMVLGGDGQGRFSTGASAVSFTGPGQWMSSNPAQPALASQAFEGMLVLWVAFAILAVPAIGRLKLEPAGRLVRPALAPPIRIGMLTGRRRFLTVLLLWAGVRFVAAFTWRDAQVLGPLNAEQLILIVLILATLLLSVVAWQWEVRHTARTTGPKLPPVPPLPFGDLPEPRSGLRSPSSRWP